MGDGSSLGVTPAVGATSQIGLVYNSVFPSRSAATYIGGLSQDNTDLNVLSQLTPQVTKDFYTFNFEQGSAIKLGFNALVGLLGDANNDVPGTTVDGTQAGLRFQLYDITGNLIADSAGTADQQAAYASLTSSSGLTAANGGYYVQISPATGTTIKDLQSYNFQLYSGTTYNTSLISTAQTQPYDPNLFVSASSTVSVSAANLSLYTNTASLSGTLASALNVGTLDANKSEVDVIGQANEQNQASYYKFDFHQGTELKFTLNNTTNPVLQAPLRVQLYDSTGKNVIADNYGTDAQQQAYTKFASGAGLKTANGTYIAKVSYAPGATTLVPQKYNFQINSGSSYDTIYKTTTSLPSATNAGATPNLGIFSDSNAQLFTRQQYNTIGATAATAVNIGYLAENKSRLDVLSQLTTADKEDVYGFTLQQGKNLKLAFNNTTNTSTARIQLFDQTGTKVFADSHGTAAQQKAFADLTSSTGIQATQGQYVVKVSYAPNADSSKKQTYNFQIYSGNTFTNSYRTTASAQTYQNAILSGNTSVVGYSSASAAASYFNSFAQGTSTDILTTLSSLV